MVESLESLNLGKAIEVAELSEAHVGKIVRLRGFLSAVRATRNVVFITLREQLDTVQCVALSAKSGQEDALGLSTLAVESFVELTGRVKAVKDLIKSCTKKHIEVDVETLKVVSAVRATLPFSLKDASASEKERASNESICKVGYNIRLDSRFLDFRMPQTLSIVRVIDSTMSLFRSILHKNRFIEIKTTKIISSGSEGGSNLFSMDFFGRKAYLAQSPQFYKQMAIAGGMKRVFEIGHVYRAEHSNINRYLSEFTGMDLEMELDGSYLEVVRFIYAVLTGIFDGLKEECSRELEIIREHTYFEDIKYPAEPCIITHHVAVDLLRAAGTEVGYEDDFSREIERTLGGIVREKYGTDLFVVTEYPAAERAFYTYADPHTGKTHSYDFILRGEEILSGAERIVDPAVLKTCVESKGIDPATMSFYLDCFNYGVPPHAGCGIGLERLMKTYFGFDDIRYFALFPRDPNRINP